MNDYLQRASVTLLIHGDDLIPDELTTLLGCEPEFATRKGETSIIRNRGTVVARRGQWHLGTGDREPPCIDQQINELLAKLPDDIALWNSLTERFDCYLALGVFFVDDSWTAGIMLQPKTLYMVGERGLLLDFDMYAPAASE